MNSFFATCIVALQSFSKKAVFVIAIFILIAGTFITISVLGFNKKYLVERPLYEGSISEGVIGSPYAINPVLAASQTDKDMSALIFSGLMRLTPDGTLIYDLAREHSVSTDKLTYTFILKENIYFHDNVAVTAEDIVYTIEKIQDENVRSAERINWERIDVRAIDTQTIQFTLKKPYPDFLKNTTLGILPKHLFGNNPSETFSVINYNTEPIGSGPYKVKSVTRKNGVPAGYVLERNTKFALGVPFIETIHVNVFDSEESTVTALKSGNIQAASAITPKDAVQFTEHPTLDVRTAPLPRLYGIFLNQNKVPALTDLRVRTALNTSIDRSLMTYETLYGFGVANVNAVPANNILAKQSVGVQVNSPSELLAAAGFTKNTAGILVKDNVELEIHIATVDIPELQTIAEFVKNSWQNLGIKVVIDSYSIGDLQDLVVRDRSFDSLLYGIVVNEDADLYAYWHSSKRQFPGLNVAQYANKQVDTLLESIQKDLGGDALLEVLTYIEKDVPAIFLFSPSFIYITPDTLGGMRLSRIQASEDRFRDVYTWYTKTESVWPFLQSVPYIKQLESFIHSI